MKISTKLVLLTLGPLVSAMFLTYISVYVFMRGDVQGRLEGVRRNQQDIIAHQMKGRVETAYAVITDCFSKNISRERCKAMIDAMRYGDDNYVWVHTLDTENLENGVLQVHPVAALRGRNLKGMVDFDNFSRIYHRGKIYDKFAPEVSLISPREVFLEINRLCIRDGGGVFRYYWPKARGDRADNIGYQKISYVKHFEPWGWVVGSGEYADHIDGMVDREKKRIRARQGRVYTIFFGFFIGILLPFGIIAFFFSKRTAFSIRRYECQILASQERLRLSEQRFIDIAFSSADIIWEIDEDGKFSFVAGNTLKILGYEPEEMVEGTPFDLILEEDLEEEKRIFERLWAEKARMVDRRYRCRSRWGNTVYLLRTGNPIIAASGNVAGYRGVDRDVTGRVVEEEERRILERELQQAHRLEAIGTLAAGIAHEINTPTQFIGDNSTFLSDSMPDLFGALQAFREKLTELGGPDEAAEAIEAIDRQFDLTFLTAEIPLAVSQSIEGVERVSKIVKTMKDFSHMGSGDMESADINNAIVTTVDISKNEWKYAADMETDLAPDLPHVTCLIGEIKQVILNLIVNAAHAVREILPERGEEKGHITVRTRRENQYVLIEISDNGAGIPDAARERIFEPFFTTKDVGEGSGQGLSLVYRTVVEKHGGTITFETENGKGTTFLVRLPINQPSGTP